MDMKAEKEQLSAEEVVFAATGEHKIDKDDHNHDMVSQSTTRAKSSIVFGILMLARRL